MSTTIKDLKLSDIKELCRITGATPTELPELFDSGDWSLNTEEEAQELVTDYIRESVVYFNASFLETMTEIPQEAFKGLQEIEDNEAVLRIIEKTCGLESFVEEAIRWDGRGHFVSFYDGNEYAIGPYFLYRHN